MGISLSEHGKIIKKFPFILFYMKFLYEIPIVNKENRPEDDDTVLVGGAITILKNDGVRQWVSNDIPSMKWKIIQIFETTNQ